MRFWKNMFGRGEVRSPEGTEPSCARVEEGKRGNVDTDRDPELNQLISDLRADRTADITSFDLAEYAHRWARLYELLAEEPSGPVLTRYVLRGANETPSNAYLIVSTVEMSQFEIESQHSMDAIRDRVRQRCRSQVDHGRTWALPRTTRITASLASPWYPGPGSTTSGTRSCKGDTRWNESSIPHIRRRHAKTGGMLQ